MNKQFYLTRTYDFSSCGYVYQILCEKSFVFLSAFKNEKENVKASEEEPFLFVKHMTDGERKRLRTYFNKTLKDSGLKDCGNSLLIDATPHILELKIDATSQILELKNKYEVCLEFKWSDTNSLANFDVPIAFVTLNTHSAEEKENKMQNENEAKIEHLIRRLQAILSKKEEIIADKYNMSYYAPKTFAEMISFLKDGKFRYGFYEENIDPEEIPFNNSMLYEISWHDPSRKPDKKGFSKAKEELFKTYQRTVDDIRILPAEEGLKSLREFEALVL